MKRQLYTRKKEKTDKLAKEQKNKDLKVVNSFKVNHSIELLEFLLLKCKASRNNVKNLLTKRCVLVNGSVATQYNLLLVKDDEVKIIKNGIRLNSNIPNTKVEHDKVFKLPFKIIYEDNDFIAINKPAGLLSVESDNERECAYLYLTKYFQLKDKSSRVFILHRIDKETSGVLVFAKNPKMHSILRLNWNDLISCREYFAVVSGKIQKSEDVITSYLKENSNNLVFSTHDKTGQKAITKYQLISQNENYSLLKVLIETGRKNQIRVHMKDIGYPIVGDDKYGYIPSPLKRLGLHASKLEFTNPITKQKISISAPIPPQFFNITK